MTAPGLCTPRFLLAAAAAEDEPAAPEKTHAAAEPEREGEGGTGTATAEKPAPTRTPPRLLPQYRVLLHNDDVNDIVYVVETVLLLTPLKKPEAVRRTLEAHRRGITLLLVTHRERAELYVEQFSSRRLTVTIEPAT